MKRDGQNDKDSRFGKVFHALIDDGIWAKMTDAEAKVYVVLTRHAHYLKRTCFVSNPTIAREAGCHKNTVSNVLKRLEEGLLIARWDFEDKYGNWRRGFRLFHQEELEQNLKSSPILSRNIYPSKMGRYASSRPRDKKGRFLDTLSMDSANPSSVDGGAPRDMAAGSPCNVDDKEKHINRDALMRKKEGEMD